MRAATPFILAILLAGCGESTNFGRTPPHAYLDWRDQLVAWAGRPMLGRIAPCWPESFVDIPTDRCVRMTEPRRWRGLWRLDFELTRFCPEPSRMCDYGTPGSEIWLTGARGVRQDGLYAVDLIGRRTAYRGEFGHLSGYDHELIVDRFIAIKKLPDTR